MINVPEPMMGTPTQAALWPQSLRWLQAQARVVHPGPLALIILVVGAFLARAVSIVRQSAYMDEGTNVLTGRLLIEHHTVYAEVLNWAYGSYLWPLVAGVADAHGGLAMVRMVTAMCGALMTLGTSLAAYRLAPPSVPHHRRQVVALLAGLAMAVAPTAIGVGRFGTYDALAAAGFMLGVGLLVPAHRNARPLTIFVAATLLFIAFLSKYLVALYFPLICLYAMFAPLVASPRRPRVALANLVFFVIPLTLACAGYLLIFLGPLLALFTSSLHYGDLKSPDPLTVYFLEQPVIWLLVAAAVAGLRFATATGRMVGLVGAGIILGFQLLGRADYDFWKHSIYVIYFLAPIAALTWLRVPQHTGTWRVVAIAVPVAVALWFLPRAEAGANHVTAFYPNFNSSLSAIWRHTSDSAVLLMDDTALRYYLYGKLPIDSMIGPFQFTYRGVTYGGADQNVDAYRSAVRDRWFDTIVLNGGVTPQGNAIRTNLLDDIEEHYVKVYSAPAGYGMAIEIYKSKSRAAGRRDPAAVPTRVTFDAGTAHWGARPVDRGIVPGLRVNASTEQPWNGQSSLQFTVADGANTVGTSIAGTVSVVQAHVYVVAADGGSQPVRVGLIGFDDQWEWRDDGYRWLVTPGVWTAVSWELARPGAYHELGFHFPQNVAVAYIGDVEIVP
jgi:hypothetical protein